MVEEAAAAAQGEEEEEEGAEAAAQRGDRVGYRKVRSQDSAEGGFQRSPVAVESGISRYLRCMRDVRSANA